MKTNNNMRLIKNRTKIIDCNFFRGQKRLMLLVFAVLMSMGLQAQTSYTLGTGKDYQDLATAINACTASGTYNLTVYDNTVTLGATATVRSGVTINVVSDVSGTQRTITRTATTGYIVVNTASAALNITDIKFDGDSANYSATAPLITVGTASISSTLNMTRCTINKSKALKQGGILYIAASGTVTLTDISILGNRAGTSNGNSYGIYNAGSLTCVGTTTMSYNFSHGALIYNKGSFTCNDEITISYKR